MSVFWAIAVLAVLIVVHELGHFLAARLQGIYVTRFSIGFGPVLWKYQGKETEYALRAIPLGGYVAFPDDELDEAIAPNDPALLQNRPILDRAIVISAGVIANLVFAYVLILTQMAWVGVPELKMAPGVMIVQIASETSSAAAQAGLQAGDIVLGVDGQSLGKNEQGIAALQAQIKQKPDQPLTLDIQRNDQPLSLQVIPTLGEDGVSRIGVQLAPNGSVVRKPAPSFVSLLGAASEEFQRLVSITVMGFGQLLTHFQDAASQVSGPIKIIEIGAEIARSNLSQLLQFGALISINLAVINILPLPALDGGQLAFLLIEGLRGRPLPLELQQGVMQTGLFLLLGLGMFLIVRDTANLTWVQQLFSQ
ncbi:MAG: RIP metalloprotease RseP [Thermosynechococcaceae cyanobacterium]